jgi:hypothetical protein
MSLQLCTACKHVQSCWPGSRNKPIASPRACTCRFFASYGVHVTTAPYDAWAMKKQQESMQPDAYFPEVDIFAGKNHIHVQVRRPSVFSGCVVVTRRNSLFAASLCDIYHIHLCIATGVQPAEQYSLHKFFHKRCSIPGM